MKESHPWRELVVSTVIASAIYWGLWIALVFLFTVIPERPWSWTGGMLGGLAGYLLFFLPFWLWLRSQRREIERDLRNPQAVRFSLIDLLLHLWPWPWKR